MRKARRSVSVPLSVKLPPKKIRVKFLLTYELEGCQKAVDRLVEYYGVKRMKIVLNGRKVGNGDLACYLKHKAYFTKNGLKKSVILHELYHHLIDTNSYELPLSIEEREANSYARNFLRIK